MGGWSLTLQSHEIWTLGYLCYQVFPHCICILLELNKQLPEASGCSDLLLWTALLIVPKCNIPIRRFCNIYLACMRLGEISHYCFFDYLCTLFFHQNGSSLAASPLGALNHHPTHILIVWRRDISIHKDLMVLAGTVYLAMLFSSGLFFFHIKYCSSLGWPTQPSRTLMSYWSAPFH